MSRIKELAIQNESMPAARAPAGVADELAAFTAAANQNLNKLIGTLLTFKKETGAPAGGRFRHGKEKVELKLGTRLVALMGEIRHGHVKWQGGQPLKAIHKLVDVPMLNRSVLGDNDETAWPISELTGKPADPWLHTIYVPLVTLDGGNYYTFSTKSYYGRCAAYGLVDLYPILARQHPGQYPIVELGCEIIPKPKYDDVVAPTFEIVGWTNKPQLALTDGGSDEEQAAPAQDDAPHDGVPPADSIPDAPEDPEVPF